MSTCACRVIHVYSKPLAEGDVDRVVVDKVFDPPGFAKGDLIAGHEQVVERNLVIGQPFSRAVLRYPQISTGTDHNAPPALPEPLHETDAVAPGLGPLVALLVDPSAEKGVFGAEQITALGPAAAHFRQIVLENFLGKDVRFVADKLRLLQGLREIVQRVVQIDGNGFHAVVAGNQENKLSGP